MLLKRKVIIALDKYEDQPSSGIVGTRRDSGIDRRSFLSWFFEQNLYNNCYYEDLNKCIDDCIEDGYINKIIVQGNPYPRVILASAFNVVREERGSEIQYEQIENIYLSSKGRALKHWYFFYPVLIEKMGSKEIVFFAITTGLVILLGYLGVENLFG